MAEMMWAILKRLKIYIFWGGWIGSRTFCHSDRLHFRQTNGAHLKEGVGFGDHLSVPAALQLHFRDKEPIWRTSVTSLVDFIQKSVDSLWNMQLDSHHTTMHNLQPKRL